MSIHPKLGAVQSTLLLPLIGRAEISKRFPNFFFDAKAIELVNNLEFDKRKAIRNMGQAGLIAMAVRAKKFDAAIQQFLHFHPKATILNVGAGLDTAFWRVDNEQLRWIDLDLPDSLSLRQQFLPPSERNPHIAKSVFDFSWIEDIGDVSDGLFIQIPGVLPYMDPQFVQSFFEDVPQRLPNAEVIFDTVSTLSAFFISQGIRFAGMKNAQLKWSINKAEDLFAWSDHLKIIKQQPYFENIDFNWKFWPTTNAAFLLNDWTNSAQIYHLRFR